MTAPQFWHRTCADIGFGGYQVEGQPRTKFAGSSETRDRSCASVYIVVRVQKGSGQEKATAGGCKSKGRARGAQGVGARAQGRLRERARAFREGAERRSEASLRALRRRALQEPPHGALEHGRTRRG